MKQFLLGAVSVVSLGAIAGYALIHSGGIDFAADSAHSPSITKFIEWAREQSVAKQAKDVIPPTDMASQERIRRGAGNYEAMCVSCHLLPGVDVRDFIPVRQTCRRQAPQLRKRPWMPVDSGLSSMASRVPGCQPGQKAGWMMRPFGT